MEVERLAALGKLSASLAHQLNTPLAVALLKIEKIRENIRGNDTLSSEVETLRESLQALKLSVQNTLGFARKPVQQRWPVDLNGLFGYQLFLREVTERVRLEQQLRQAEKLSALGAQLLEKMIAAEWHAFSVLLDRLERSGIVRKDAERTK